MRVFVYFNLHKLLWSVRALAGPDKGRVIRHVDQVHLVDCHFKVSEAGRQRVLRERQKNVHAGVVGHLLETTPDNADTGQRVIYNPYKYPTFVHADTLEPVFRADCVLLRARSAYILEPSAEGVRMPVPA